MEQILLVAMLILPGTNNVAYEIVGRYQSPDACWKAVAERKHEQERVQTVYSCLPADKN